MKIVAGQGKSVTNLTNHEEWSETSRVAAEHKPGRQSFTFLAKHKNRTVLARWDGFFV